MNVRAVAAKTIYQVVDQGQSLTQALPEAYPHIHEKDHALLHEICYGVLRFLPRLEAITQVLLTKPLKGKQRVFHHVILVGIYQLAYMRIPSHAALNETVNAAVQLKGPGLRGLINAVLRRYQREQATLDQQAVTSPAGQYAHPNWILQLLTEAYPESWQQIVAQNNQKAPIWLRVNSTHQDRASYQSILAEQDIQTSAHPQAMDALSLDSACPITALPGFEQGWVSVQDAAAQLAVDYLQPQDGEVILDCCAAPGGKTTHILERAPRSHVIALDCDATRIERVRENLHRLGQQASVLVADARLPEQWKDKHPWPGQTNEQQQYDRILLDAPCSGLGVIRRHPDIKWLRRAADLEQLVALQQELLQVLWQELKPGGTFVYATCSIAPQENTLQIKQFLQKTKDASLIGSDTSHPGRQILPGEAGMDGFYYAVLQKENV